MVKKEPVQTELLQRQLGIIEQYSKILISRIALIQDNIDKGEN